MNAIYRTDIVEETIDTLYIKPYTRFNPYLGGLLIGYILYKIKDTKIELNSTSVVAFWTIAVVIFSFTIHMTYKRDVQTWLCSLWFSLGKFSFGLFIGSVVLICQLGYGGRRSSLKKKISISHQLYILSRSLFRRHEQSNFYSFEQAYVQHVHGQSHRYHCSLWSEGDKFTFWWSRHSKLNFHYSIEFLETKLCCSYRWWVYLVLPSLAT